MNCKHGDLSIIVDDFEGCKGNIGLLVRVIGPAEIVMDMPCWQVIPLSGQGMWLIDDDKARKRLITPRIQAIHPDKWLKPIRGNSTAQSKLERELV
jgi:hypothetical protein